MQLGEYNQLTILRFTPPGAYLADEQENVVLLPNKYLTPDMEEGQSVSVFLYLDSEDRIVATTEKPYIERNTFAFLTVKEVNHFGAFLDWGLEKDLMVPFREQTVKMEEGKSYLVYMFLDDATQRLIASAKVKKFLETEHIVVKEQEEVELLIGNETDLGVNVIVNDTYSGLIFKNNFFKHLQRGDRTRGYVQKVREDGKLDILLEKEGIEKIAPNALLLLEKLNENNGFLPLTDKSDPDTIQQVLGMSKKTFKQAVGSLYKQRVISIEENGLRRIK